MMYVDRNALAADENLKHSTATEVSALQQRAEDLLRKARERREEAVRAELREKIAGRISSLGCQCGQSIERWGGHAKAELRHQLAQGQHYDATCPVELAARIRAGEFG